MCDEIIEINPDSQPPLLEASEQRPGEPDKWYRHFQRYCQLGPGRSLLRCYQLVMGEHDERAHGGNGSRPKAKPKRTHTPATWRQVAAQFEWDRRARAYDQGQNEQFEHALQHTLLKTSNDLQEVRQFYLDLMRGWIRSPEGELEPVTDIYQRRMAAKALQNLVGMLRSMLDGGEHLEDGDEVEIREILAHQPPGSDLGNPHDRDQTHDLPAG